MPEVKRTIDADGGILTSEIEGQQITVSFERANTEYGNGPKAGVHVRVPVPLNADEQAVTLLADHWGEWARGVVDAQLEKAGGPTPKGDGGGGGGRKPGGAGGGRKGGGSPGPRLSDAEYEAKRLRAWEHYAANPDVWFDNRDDPQKPPKGPDFKGKTEAGEFKNFGLWLDSKPDHISV